MDSLTPCSSPKRKCLPMVLHRVAPTSSRGSSSNSNTGSAFEHEGQPYSLIKPAQQPWLVVTEAARLAQGRGWDDCILEESATETDWIDDFVHEQLTELEQKETDSNKQMSMAVKAWKIHNRCIHDVLRSGALNSIGPNCKDGPQKWVDLNEMHFGGSEGPFAIMTHPRYQGEKIELLQLVLGCLHRLQEEHRYTIRIGFNGRPAIIGGFAMSHVYVGLQHNAGEEYFLPYALLWNPSEHKTPWKVNPDDKFSFWKHDQPTVSQRVYAAYGLHRTEPEPVMPIKGQGSRRSRSAPVREDAAASQTFGQPARGAPHVSSADAYVLSQPAMSQLISPPECIFPYQEVQAAAPERERFLGRLSYGGRNNVGLLNRQVYPSFPSSSLTAPRHVPRPAILSAEATMAVHHTADAQLPSSRVQAFVEHQAKACNLSPEIHLLLLQRALQLDQDSPMAASEVPNTVQLHAISEGPLLVPAKTMSYTGRRGSPAGLKRKCAWGSAEASGSQEDLESLPVSNAPCSLVPNIAALPMSMDLEGIGLLGFIPDADDIPDLPMLDGSEPMLDDSELKRFNFDLTCIEGE